MIQHVGAISTAPKPATADLNDGGDLVDLFSAPHSFRNFFAGLALADLSPCAPAAQYHTASFHDPIRPIVIGHWPEQERYIGVKLTTAGKSPDDIHKLLGSMKRSFKSIYPDRDFNYVFMDESIRNMYEDEQKLSLLVRAAMLVTIFISCMGLFGVALFAAEKRTKEVSIRKVLGAGVPDLVLLLCKDFVVLVGLSVLIASPLAWWAMNKWLEGFAYRVGLGVPVFAIAGLCGMVITVLTVSFQAFRVANANPVERLRTQ